MTPPADPRAAFIEAAIWHGPLAPAEAILSAHPELAGAGIHTAAILGDDAAVRRLLEPGSPVDVPNADGDRPLALAVRACVDSYWTECGSPALVEALIRAGASVPGIPYPSGDAGADAVLAKHRT